MNIYDKTLDIIKGLTIRNSTGLEVTLISLTGKMQHLFLPYPAKGVVRFAGELVENIPIYFEADQGNWYCVRDNASRFISVKDPFVSKILVNNQDLLVLRRNELLFMLYTEEVNDESFIRHNYAALPSDIYIGRNDDNDITYYAPMISGKHAVFHYNGTKWRIHDLDSRNGIYVNGYRVKSMNLELGDTIDIFGLRIIIGSRFVSINDGNNRVSISSQKIRPVDSTDNVMGNVFPGSGQKSMEMFNRYPRKRLALEEKTIELENPPMPLGKEGIPLLMRMGSSMIMGGTAALTGNMTMLASAMILPLLTQGYSREDREEYEKRRLEKYREYLAEKYKEILCEKQHEEYVLQQNYPELAVVLGYAFDKKKLWARTKNDDDFLNIRIGRGNIPLKAKIDCVREYFELEEDILKEELHSLADKRFLLENVPIMINMIENNVIGVQGQSKDVTGFINILVFRLALLFSYDEVKLIFLLDEENMLDMEYIKYLPHTWDDQRLIRFTATNASEAYQIGEHIQNELEKDIKKPRKWEQIKKERPYYIVFALNKKLFDSVEVFKKAVQQDFSIGVSVITGFPDVPKECRVLLELNKQSGDKLVNDILYVKELDREDDYFVPDIFEAEDALKSMQILANTKLRLISQEYTLPKTISFLEMYDVGKIEDLNIAERWQKSDPVTSLTVPVGIATDGTPFVLDLHQKYQGPHGLVAGTTGSGKSEFLITYILSLAVNYHPDEVAFLLIDYKGGGLAGAFDDPQNDIHLPHLAGTITNLDGAAISRSLVSIQSEVLRRQKIFNEAKSLAGEGTMDIYMYQRLYRMGVVKTAMPHLFIISDEFAELKQQQPDFLNQLVSIARIGRSLGVHLILATQKPSGVVTDQILSNTKFRVCLKVQDRADSMDMLKRPEAADIRETGRFYLQVGNDELFAMGQSAWSGAAYEFQEKVIKQKDESIQVIDHIGSPVLTVKPETEKKTTGKSQLVSVVKSIMQAAKEEKIFPKELWLPVLAPRIPVDINDFSDTEDLNLYIGRIDDPEKQAQYPLYLNLTTCGHILVCGESGSGKTTFIKTLLYSMTRKHSPDQFQFYILDFSSHLLKIFRNLPHCGAVIEEDTVEQSMELFKLLTTIIQERKKLFSELEVSNYSEAAKLKKLPFILVVFDNVAGFLQTKAGQKQYDMLQYYLKSSVNYGVSYLFTISHVNEINMRTRQEFKQRIALQLRDRYEYTDILNVKCMYMPPELPGRGIYSYEGRPLEMQLAMFAPDLDQKERTRVLKCEVERLICKNQKFEKARQIVKIKEGQTYDEFMMIFEKNRLPLGYDVNTSKAVSLPLKQFEQLSMYFSEKNTAAVVFQNIKKYAETEEMVLTLLKRKSESCFENLVFPSDARIFAASKEDIEQFATFLLVNVNHRYELYKQYCEKNGLNEETAIEKQDVFLYMRNNFRPIIVFIERYSYLVSFTIENAGFLSKFSSSYILAKYCQIYFVAGFYSDEPTFLWGNDLFKCYNPQKMALLFGTKLDKQYIVRLPYDVEKLLSKKDYNHFIMSYRKELHHMVMPCGEIIVDNEKSDDDSIFEDA